MLRVKVAVFCEFLSLHSQRGTNRKGYQKNENENQVAISQNDPLNILLAAMCH